MPLGHGLRRCRARRRRCHGPTDARSTAATRVRRVGRQLSHVGRCRGRDRSSASRCQGPRRRRGDVRRRRRPRVCVPTHRRVRAKPAGPGDHRIQLRGRRSWPRPCTTFRPWCFPSAPAGNRSGQSICRDVPQYLGAFWSDRARAVPPTADLARAYLNPVPPTWLGPDDPPWPTLPIRTTGFSHGAAPVPTWLATPGERPRAYVTLGTVAFGAVDALRRAVVETAAAGVDVLVAIGPDGDPAAFGSAAGVGAPGAIRGAGTSASAGGPGRPPRWYRHHPRCAGGRRPAGDHAAGRRPVPSTRSGLSRSEPAGWSRTRRPTDQPDAVRACSSGSRSATARTDRRRDRRHAGPAEVVGRVPRARAAVARATGASAGAERSAPAGR